MKFETLTMHAVKSISQRSILLYWNALAKHRHFPAFSDFSLDARMHDPKQLAIWSVENEAGRRRFRAQFQGEALVEAFHSKWVGKTMDEVVPRNVKRYTVDTANECVESRCAIFSILSTLDDDGNRIDCERLMLPFGREGLEVQQIVVSMQLISLRGTFETKTVLHRYGLTSTVELAGRIKQAFRSLGSRLWLLRSDF